MGGSSRNGRLPTPRNQSRLKLSREDEEAVMKHVRRWGDHGFPVGANKLISLVANAYLERKPPAERQKIALSWGGRLLGRYAEFEEWFVALRALNKRKASKGRQQKKFVDFLRTFGELKQKHRIKDENIWCVGDLGFVLNISREGQVRTIHRPQTENAQDELRELASVIYCIPRRGEPLSPQVVYKTKYAASPSTCA